LGWAELLICAGCKKIRNHEGIWEGLEVYIEKRSEARFTHGICPECSGRLR
jgi:two-component system cell cycle response regulator